MVKLAGVIVVCAIAAFAAAFYAAGADTTTTVRAKTHPKAVPFTDSAASGVAGSFAGNPAALKLPPPRHVKHHSKPAATSAPVAPVTTPATASAPAYVTPVKPPAKQKGSGTGVTVIGGR